MSSISFAGAGSGIDWSKLIDAEIQARRAHIITPIEQWQTSWKTKMTAFDELASLLSKLRDTVRDMDTGQELRSYTAESSSESTLGVSASSSAMPGTHTVEINQLAGAEVEIHGGVDDATTVVNNSGTSKSFVYLYAGQSISVTVEDGTTLEELAGLISGDPNNPGVYAYVLDDGLGGASSHHLVLTGTDTGSTYTISVDGLATTLGGDWGDLTADASAGASSVTVDDVSSFAQYQAIIIADDDSAAEYHIVDSIAASTLNLKGMLGDNFSIAQNAYASARGIGSGLSAGASGGASEVTVDDASRFQVGKSVIVADGRGYQELTISAVDTTTNTLTFSSSLTNSYLDDGYVTQLEGGRKFTFADTDFTQAQAAKSAQLRVDGYPPASWIERETNVISDAIQGVTLTLNGRTSGTPVTVTVHEDTAAVKEKIKAFVEAYNAVKTFLNEQTSYDAAAKTGGVLLGNYAAEIVESQLSSMVTGAAPGFQEGTDTFTHLAQIGIHTVGQADKNVDLGLLKIEENQLDGALSVDLDAVIKLFAADFQGYSDSSYLTFHQASDLLTTPGTYDVEVDFDAGGNITAARIKLSSESTFRDATINSSYIVGTADNPESGLWVKAVWDGSSSTQTATVRVTQGIAGATASALDDVLGSTEGILHNIDKSYNDVVGQLQDRIDREEERLTRWQERLVLKYARLEQLLIQLKSQLSWSTQTASGISGSATS